MLWFGAGWVRRSYSLDERPIGPADQCFPLVPHGKAGARPQAQEWVKHKTHHAGGLRRHGPLMTSYVLQVISAALPWPDDRTGRRRYPTRGGRSPEGRVCVPALRCWADGRPGR